MSNFKATNVRTVKVRMSFELVLKLDTKRKKKNMQRLTNIEEVVRKPLNGHGCVLC